MLKTFLSEFTTQSNTALSFGTRLIVFKGRKTRRTRRDLMVFNLALRSLTPLPPPSSLSPLLFYTHSCHKLIPKLQAMHIVCEHRQLLCNRKVSLLVA
jgi:hypothetical protein